MFTQAMFVEFRRPIGGGFSIRCSWSCIAVLVRWLSRNPAWIWPNLSVQITHPFAIRTTNFGCKA